MLKNFPPSQSSNFCVLVGTGVQLVAMASVVIFGAAAGYLNPARRGSIAMGLLLIFVLFGALVSRFDRSELRCRHFTCFAGVQAVLTYTTHTYLHICLLYITQRLVMLRGVCSSCLGAKNGRQSFIERCVCRLATIIP